VISKMDDEKKIDPLGIDTDDEKEHDITGDGGVLKKILKKGLGFERPSTNSSVNVHYTGKLLDGTVFDSSVTRNEPFNFKLGAHQVIKGWEEAVSTMKIGEKALYTMKPEYAYGASGSEKIPPNATLQFEIELIDWISDTDLSKNKDGSIKKKIIKEGSGDSPKAESRISIKLTGMLEDGTVFEPTKKIDAIVGRGDIGYGLNVLYKSLMRGIKDMKKDETCLLILKPVAAWGSVGCPEKNVPPNATVKFELELTALLREKENWEMSSAEKLEAAKVRREEGNQLFKEGKFKRAIKRYKNAIDCIQYEDKFDDIEKVESKKLKVPCYLNIAATSIKLQDTKAVIENCNKALDIDKANIKALFRRAQANTELKDFDLAITDLRQALELDPSNAEINREIARVNKLLADQEKKDKILYGRMFQALSSDDRK